MMDYLKFVKELFERGAITKEVYLEVMEKYGGK